MAKLIVGYCDPLSAAPGDTVRFMVSSLAAEPFDAQLVRIVCGDISPDGAGFQEVEVAHPINSRYEGEAQPIVSGSYAVVEPHPLLRSLDSLAVGVSAWPTDLPRVVDRPCSRRGIREPGSRSHSMPMATRSPSSEEASDGIGRCCERSGRSPLVGGRTWR